MSTVNLIFLTIVLVGTSGFLAGILLGLLSLSTFELKRKASLGDKRAKRVYPLRARGHELLISLVVYNVLINAALTSVLDSYLSSIIAVLVSTILITAFAEVLPQALLKKHALAVASSTASFIEFLLKILSPISKPLGKFLDKRVGVEIPSIYSKDELIKILEEHTQSDDSEIEADEIRIVVNALRFGDVEIGEVMTPKSVIEAVEVDEVLNTSLIEKLHKTGVSRFPVFKDSLDHIVGLLYLKDLVAFRGGHTPKVLSIMDREVFFVNESQKLDHVLNAFLKTKNHLFMVVNEFSEVVGLITIEDILEQIIGREIVDEFDNFDDMRKVAELKGKERQKALKS